MLALPTTTISIYRGTTTNGYGDDVDDNSTALLTGVRASILEQTRIISEPVTGITRTVRFVTGRVGNGTNLLKEDRVLDENTNVMYSVMSVRNIENPVIPRTDVVFELQYTDAV